MESPLAYWVRECGIRADWAVACDGLLELGAEAKWVDTLGKVTEPVEFEYTRTPSGVVRIWHRWLNPPNPEEMGWITSTSQGIYLNPTFEQLRGDAWLDTNTHAPLNQVIPKGCFPLPEATWPRPKPPPLEVDSWLPNL